MRELLRQVTALLNDKKKRKEWMKLVSVLAGIVVFISVYLLVLPALTMEKNASCGIPEHQHSDECYELRLVCGLEENEDTSDDIVTDGISEDGFSDMDIVEDLEPLQGHVHTDSCYEYVLVCVKEPHTHSAACYKTQAGSAAENTVDESTVSQKNGSEQGDYIEENAAGDELVYEEGAAEDLTDVSLSSDEEETADILTESVEASAENGAQEDEYSEASLDEDSEQPVKEDAGSAEVASSPSVSSGEVSEVQPSESVASIVYMEGESVDGGKTGGQDTGTDSETAASPAEASADDGKTVGSDQDAGAENGTGAPAAEGSADGAAAENKEGGNVVSEQGTEDGNSVQEPGAAGQEAQTEDPLQGPVSLADYLTGATAVYYSRTAGTDGEDEWKPVENDTVLMPSDKIRVYLAYQLPAGLLNSTNSQARYMLPEQLWLSDSRVDKINHFMNGMAAGTEDEAERASLLGAEAVEGSRRPDENSSGKTENISAIVNIENLQDTKGKFTGQELVFRFVPYTVEKNSDVFDAEGALTSKGQEVNGYFTIDYMVDEIMSGIAADSGASSEQILEAVIVFASGNKESGQNEISAKLMISETAAEPDPAEQDSKTAEANPGSAEGESAQTDPESSGEGNAQTGAESSEAETADKGTSENEGGESAKDASDGSATAAEAADDLSDQLPDMPAQIFEETIRVKTGGTGSGNAVSDFFKNVVGFFTGKGGADSDDAGKALSSEAELTVHVDADEGTFPAGTTMTVKAVSGRELNAVSEAISDAVDSETCGFQAVDITFRNAQGEEIEPEKPVRVTFSTDLISEAAQNEKIGDPVIVHLQDNGSVQTLSGNASDNEASDKKASGSGKEDAGTGATGENSVSFEAGENAGSGEDQAADGDQKPVESESSGQKEKPAEEDGSSQKEDEIREDGTVEEDTAASESSTGNLSFDADQFSIYAIVYTVDFKYSVDGMNYEYSLTGGGYISLADLVKTLGIVEKTDFANADKFVAQVEDVKFTDDSLLWVGKAGEDTTVGELKQSEGIESLFAAQLTKEEMEAVNNTSIPAGSWALISLLPFDSEEKLTITMKNGDVWTVDVTDAQLKKTVISASGDTYEITVTYGDDAEIPDDSVLDVVQLQEDDSAYAEYLTQTARAIERSEEALDYIKLLNIRILDPHGKEVEPKAPVDVQIRLLDREEKREEKEPVQVVHFGKETEVLESTKDKDAVCFTTDGFSVYAIVTLDDLSQLKGSDFSIINTQGGNNPKGIALMAKTQNKENTALQGNSTTVKVDPVGREDNVYIANNSTIWHFDFPDSEGRYLIFRTMVFLLQRRKPKTRADKKIYHCTICTMIRLTSITSSLRALIRRQDILSMTVRRTSHT